MLKVQKRTLSWGWYFMDLWHEGGIGGGEVSCEVDGTEKSSPATGRKSRARLARSPCLKSITPPPPRTLCSVSSRDGCDWALQ